MRVSPINAEFVLRAKSVREHIIANPGCAKEDLYAAMKPDGVGAALGYLQTRRMVRFEGGGKKGAARWYAILQ